MYLNEIERSWIQLQVKFKEMIQLGTHSLREISCKERRIPGKTCGDGTYRDTLTLHSLEYSECQAFYPVVRIGSPIQSPARECWSSPPLWVQGGRHTRLPGRGSEDPIPTMGQTLWYSREIGILQSLYAPPTRRIHIIYSSYQSCFYYLMSE
jgi:hypothetical protein